MVEATSSIARPFVPPKPHASLASESGETATSELVLLPTDRRTSSTSTGKDPPRASKKRVFGAVSQAATATTVDALLVSVFPSVARRVLSEPDVSALYGFIRQLHAGRDVDDALAGMCALLRDSAESADLVNLLPTVLHGAISDRFVAMATSLGLPLDLSLATDDNGDSTDTVVDADVLERRSGMATFFERIQQTRKRKLHDATHVPTVAVVENPQCGVCYDITRKAYAAQCGHLCCMGCWQKMEKDGFTSCPLCKVPLKLEQLSLIRAAKK